MFLFINDFMNFNFLILTLSLILQTRCLLVAQDDKVENRLEIVRNFITSLKDQTQSNEEIMTNYVECPNYFNRDSTVWQSSDYTWQSWRKFCDSWIDKARVDLKKMNEKAMGYLKYSDHEKNFAVYASDGLEDLNTLRNLKFRLGFLNGIRIDVDINDVYLVKDNSSDGNTALFIVFDKADKILSFGGLRSREVVNLWQW
jgi:hypothetical protein